MGEGEGKISRRGFIAISAASIAGIAVAYFAGRATAPVREVARTETVTVERERPVTTTVTAAVPVLRRYERVRIANIRDLRVGEPLEGSYMGKPIVVLKLGEPAQGGVGPEGDIVAFSILCTHMGGRLVYDPSNKALVCPLHYSVFDPARGGMIVVGHGTEYLPQVVLEYDERTGDIYAIGFNRLVYGVESNL